MLPNFIHLLVVMTMVIAAVIVFVLVVGDAMPKAKVYGSQARFHYENDGFKLFLLLFLLVGFFFLHFSGFKLCDFLAYWLPPLHVILYHGICQ